MARRADGAAGVGAPQGQGGVEPNLPAPRPQEVRRLYDVENDAQVRRVQNAAMANNAERNPAAGANADGNNEVQPDEEVDLYKQNTSNITYILVALLYLIPCTLLLPSANKVPVTIRHYEAYEWYNKDFGSSTDWSFKPNAETSYQAQTEPGGLQDPFSTEESAPV